MRLQAAGSQPLRSAREGRVQSGVAVFSGPVETQVSDRGPTNDSQLNSRCVEWTITLSMGATYIWKGQESFQVFVIKFSKPFNQFLWWGVTTIDC